MPRPLHEPNEATRALVENASAIGLRHEEIAKHVGIDDKTLRKHFRKELDQGAFKANMKVGGVLFELATKCPDLNTRYRAAAFWAARRMGWVEGGGGSMDPSSEQSVTVRVIGGFAASSPQEESDS